jgi:transcriptional regulator with XRE-family HTH domain
MSPNLTIGQVVRTIREGHNESQREMARKLQCSNTFIHLVEHDKVGVSLEFLGKIKKQYGVDPYIMAFEPRLEMAKTVLAEWQNQQGHNACWYYPDVFNSLCAILGVESKQPKSLPPEEEFKRGCRRYRREIYADLEQKVKA